MYSHLQKRVLKLQRRKSQRRLKKVKESSPEPSNVLFSYADAEERVAFNERYPEQTVLIGKQLPTESKRRLQELLRVNAYIFTWTYADTTRVPTMLVIDGKPFGTKHKLNEYNHIEPIEQNKEA
ncbi:hypothetical protein Tco_1469141 [Tanacetum coccineum]